MWYEVVKDYLTILVLFNPNFRKESLLKKIRQEKGKERGGGRVRKGDGRGKKGEVGGEERELGGEGKDL